MHVTAQDLAGTLEVPSSQVHPIDATTDERRM